MTAGPRARLRALIWAPLGAAASRRPQATHPADIANDRGRRFLLRLRCGTAWFPKLPQNVYHSNKRERILSTGDWKDSGAVSTNADTQTPSLSISIACSDPGCMMHMSPAT